jgi:Fe-S-cluster containining protein
MSEPWYRDGLRFRCTQCGHCCTGAPGFVWVNDAELADIAAQLDAPVAEVRDRFSRAVGDKRSLRERPNGDCVFYDRAKGCTVYAARPRQCRTWPFWEHNVRTPEAWEETCNVCPGSGRGDLIPAEEITRRIRVIRL